MERSLSFSWIRRLSLVTLFFTGACGLIYEVTWHRYLANLVGSESRASALILAVFLGGLAIGYEVFGRVSLRRSPRTLIKTMGWLELGIGIWAILFPSLYELAWNAIASGAAITRMGLFGDSLMAIFLILVPTILMGGTLPLLTQAFSLDLDGSAKVHALIYSMNTLGAFLGCLIAGFVLIPDLGLPLTLLYTSFINVAAGVALIGVASSASDELPAGGVDKERLGTMVRRLSSLWPAFAIAFAAGFCAITLQTALVRLVGLTAGSSEYSFSMIVAIYILMLAVGAYQVSRSPEGPRNRIWFNQVLIGAGLLLIYVTVPDWPYWAHVLRSIFAPVAPSFYVYHVMLFAGLGLLLAIPIHAMGRTMPLLFAAIARKVERVGEDVGAIYFVNTIGCVAGGIVGGYLLYYLLDLDQVLKLLVLVTSVAALLALATFESSSRRPFAFAAVALVIVFGVAWPRWEPSRLTVGTFRTDVTPWSFAGARAFYEAFNEGYRTILRRDGPNSSLGITEELTANPARSIVVNGKSDGHTREDRVTVALIAHLPALFSDASLKRVAIIGFGTGMTVGSAALYPEVEAIDVFEISETLYEHASEFDFANGGMSKNSKVVWHVGDAYHTLLGSTQQYGFIASEPSNPWVVGVERLYSREFYELAASRLEPGGVYAQWLHTYDLSRGTFGVVMKTFSSVFADVKLFRTKSGDVVMLGSAKRLANRLPSLDSRWKDEKVKADLAAIGIDDVSELLAREIPLPARSFDGSALHTLEIPKLSYLAGHDFFMRARVDLEGLVNSPRFSGWWNRGFDDRLSETWLTSKGPGVLTSLVPAWCGREKLEFFPEWRQASALCYKGLARATGVGLIGGIEGFDVRETSILKAIASNKSPTPASSSSAAAEELDFVVRSSFSRLRRETVDAIAVPCKTTPTPACTLAQARALASIGLVAEAEHLMMGVPASLDTELTRAILTESRAAFIDPSTMTP